MGEVYRARDPRLGRDVAVKVLPPGTAEGDRLARFVQEARTIAALSHPNLLAIFDVGTGDSPYLVTELLDGETLRARLDRGAFPPADAVAIGRQIAAGLDAAHGRGFPSARALAHALEAAGVDATRPAAPVSGVPAASVAVLPFDNLGAAGDDHYFGDGLAEDLVNALARLPGLRVASRTSSFHYRGRQLDLRAVGRDLGVRAVVGGSVRRAGSRLRLTVHLTNVDDGYHLWSERYDRELTEVFDVQDDMVAAIVAAVAPTLIGGEERMGHRPTTDLQAYDLYLKGRHLWNQRSPSVVEAAIACFEAAIALDPGFAAAFAGLADCYSILRVYGWKPAAQVQPRALEAVRRALTIDPQLALAHRAHGIYTFHFESHWRAAEESFLAALGLDPADAVCRATYAMFLATAYRAEEARFHLGRALEQEPHSAQLHFLAASTACALCDAELAGRHAVRSLELQPDALGPRWPQTVSLLMAGRHDEVVALGEQIIARARTPVFVGVQAMIYARAGRLDDARRLGEELYERAGRGEYVSPASLLALALGLEDRGLVRQCLLACVDGGAAPFAVVATNRWLLDGYRGDSEIDLLLDRLHDGARP
jgi:TolB-like protein/Tfp pilus assembly protein PilF